VSDQKWLLRTSDQNGSYLFFLGGSQSNTKQKKFQIFGVAIAFTTINDLFKSNVLPTISCNLLFQRNAWWIALLDGPIDAEEKIIDVQKSFGPWFWNGFMLNTLKLDDFRYY
jgi:hypothetical protein